MRDVVELARRDLRAGRGTLRRRQRGPHEVRLARARRHEGARCSRRRAVLPLEQAVGLTMAWYRAHGQGADARQLCDADISDFETRSVAIDLPLRLRFWTT